MGALVWFTVAAAGLAAIAAAFAGVLVVIRYAGAAYLLYLAWKLWTPPPRSPSATNQVDEGRGLFLTGLALNLGNPKAAAFHAPAVRLEPCRPPGQSQQQRCGGWRRHRGCDTLKAETPSSRL